MSTTTRKVLFAFCAMGLITMGTLLGGAAGCSSGGGGGAAATGDSGGSGVTVSTLKDIPEADVTNYLSDTTTSLSAALKSEVSGAPVGSKWVQLCYMEQCLGEAIRHAKEFDFFTCMMKAAVDSGVVIPADGGTAFYEIVPPPFEDLGVQQALVAPTGASSGSSDVQAAAIDTDGFLIRIRIKKQSDVISLALCEPDENGSYQQVEEFIIDNSNGQFTGDIRFNWNFGLETEQGFMKLQTSCPSAASFRDGTCTDAVTLQNYFDGSFGAGGIDLGLTSPTAYTLVFDFTGEDIVGGGGSFDVAGKGNITSTKGCISNKASGSYPAVPRSEVPWIDDVAGCASIVQQTRFCFVEIDDDIDFGSECPVKAAPATELCAFADDEALTECGNVGAGDIGKREGTIADTSDGSFAGILTALDALENTATRDPSFTDKWDCTAGSFTAVDMSNNTAAVACEEKFEEIDQYDNGGESCEENHNEDLVEEEFEDDGLEGDDFQFDDTAGIKEEAVGCPGSTSCTDDFTCQKFAESDSDLDESERDEFETHNVRCSTTTGCCVLK